MLRHVESNRLELMYNASANGFEADRAKFEHQWDEDHEEATESTFVRRWHDPGTSRFLGSRQ
jgi:hypothetical protein